MADYKDRMGYGDMPEPQTLAEADPDDAEVKGADVVEQQKVDPNWRARPDFGRPDGSRPLWITDSKPLWDYLWGHNCMRNTAARALSRDLVQRDWRNAELTADEATERLWSLLVARDLRDLRVAETVAGIIAGDGFERRQDPPKPGDHFEATGVHRDLARWLGRAYENLNGSGPVLVGGRYLAIGVDMLIYPGDVLLCTTEGVEVLGPDRRYPTGQIADYTGSRSAEPDESPEEAPEVVADDAPQSPLVGIMTIVDAFSPEARQKMGRDVADALRPFTDLARRARGEDPQA